MTKFARLTLVVGLLVCGLVFASEARASILPIETTIEGWQSEYGGEVVHQDKKYTLLGTTLVPTTSLTFEVYSDALGDYHTLGFKLNLSAVSSAYLFYSVEILSPSPFYFSSAALDSEVTPGNAQAVVKKWIDDDDKPQVVPLLTLTSTNGSNTYDQPLPGGLKKIWVYETFSVTSGQLKSASNTFSQAIPEPATLAVWSVLGLAGGGMWVVRRRRNVSAGRTPWSEENRTAICQVIERGRS